MKNELSRSLLERGCDAYEAGRYQLAASLFLRAARLGNGDAQVNLANMYSDGAHEVDRDDKRASHWYRLAVSKGIPEAAYNLALHHLKRGGNRWFRYWIKRAADMGDRDALDMLWAAKVNGER